MTDTEKLVTLVAMLAACLTPAQVAEVKAAWKKATEEK